MGIVNLHFFQVPPYHELYRVKRRTTNYRRVIKPTDRCIPTMSHGSADIFQAEDGKILFAESIVPRNFYPCA
jgi:hypothetical protein